jgi:hypothetical protein
MANMSDDFNRADSAVSLGTSSSGHAWTGVNGGERLGIQSNRAYRFTANGYAILPAAAADGWTRFTVAAGGANDRLGVAVRHDGAANINNVISLMVRDGGVHLSKRVAAVGSTINLAAYTAVNGDVVTMSFQGSSYKVWVNATLIINVTDTSLNSNTRHGITINDAGGRLDDYSFTEGTIDIADPETVSVTATAYNASVAVMTAAELVPQTITAYNASVAVGAKPQLVTSTVTTNATTGSVAFSAGTVLVEIRTASATDSGRRRTGSWQPLIAMIEEGRQIDVEEATRIPVECPNDYTTLLEAPGGGLFCPWDGWKYPEDA